jgi:hypothetical protein
MALLHTQFSTWSKRFASLTPASEVICLSDDAAASIWGTAWLAQHQVRCPRKHLQRRTRALLAHVIYGAEDSCP